ncbi:RNA polymerase sigma factor [Alteromonas sp. 1_MG-2023]|uniref:RNA polymerase sigma factor n=1 Tax=unclassified Alteromonas TaxID=2614992 RepID=UPI0026E46EAA|nr:RNA polymerase sigma factor [Alteromonas sp. 1_MG-2023]MDO6476326.1 RNA polymerase sigma factor [Alteromonas sp. 1_MG-2023]
MEVIYLKKLVKNANDNSELVTSLLEEHGSALRRFIRVRSNLPMHECEDVMQMVCERLLKVDNLTKLVEGRLDTVRGYLFQIAVNLLIDRKRRNDARQSQQHVGEQDVTIFTNLYSPERELEGKHRLRRIQEILNGIKLPYKQAFLLSRVDGKSYREISDILGVSVSTVEKYVAKALLAVRKGVGEHE